MVDASGRIDAAFVWGNNFWLGSKSSCARLSDPHRARLDDRYEERLTLKNLSDIVPPIRMVYRMTYAHHFSTIQFDPQLLDKVRTADLIRVHYIMCVTGQAMDKLAIWVDGKYTEY